MSTQTGCSDFGLASAALQAPFLVETVFSSDGDRRVSGGAEPFPTQTTRQSAALAMPFLTSVNYFDDRTIPVDEPGHTQTTQTKFGVTVPPPFLDTAGSRDTAAAEVGAPVPTLTGSERFGLVSPFIVTLRGTEPYQLQSYPGGIESPLGTVSAGGIHHGIVSPFLVTLRRNMDGASPADPLATVCAGAQHHAVVQGAALMTMRDSRAARGRTDANYPLREVTDPLSTQVAACTQDWLLQRWPYLVQYYQNGTASGIADAVPTVTTLDRHGLAEPGPELRVEDCYFRMLQPHEIQAAMAFPESYQVLGNSRDKVKQLGNAVTPPAMAWLIERCVASLHPEVRR